MDGFIDFLFTEASQVIKSPKTGLLVVFEGIDGVGKCFKRGTPVLMYDGSIKNIEDIKVDDVVMGDDSTPRNVTSCHSGIDQMYRITPTKGESFVVNGNHTLVLKVAGNKSPIRKYVCDDGLVRISTYDFCNQSDCWKRHMMLYRCPVDYSSQAVKIDPYILGVWLGDGSSSSPSIHTADPEIVISLQKEAEERNLKLTVTASHKTSPRYNFAGHSRITGNSFFKDLKNYGLIKNKHVPDCYKINNRNIRLQILAGLIDTDGYVCNRGIEFVNKNEKLAKDVVYLARSLGMAAYIKKCTKRCQTGAVGEYFRVFISGDCHLIPMRIKRKSSPRRTINKDPLKVGLKVEPVEVGEYFGFETDGNHLFLLGDFTVVHNSTAYNSLYRWLKKQKYKVTKTKWNSSALMSRTIDKAKDRRMMTPLLYSLLHASDMVVRYETEILPALQKNQIVLCDRYIYTSMVRDQARGVRSDLLDHLYSGWRKPDILFHCKLSVKTALERLQKEKGLSYYGSGMDMNLANTKEENYLKYGGKMDRLYSKILPKVKGYQLLDMSGTKDQTVDEVKKIVETKLKTGQYAKE